MKIILCMICLIACALAVIPPDSHAQSANPSIPCSVSVRAYTVPAPLFHDGDRRNPDKSLYPGDAMHYLFVYRGSDTCLGFDIKELRSYGMINVVKHNTAQAINVTGLEPDEPRPVLVQKRHAHSTHDIKVEWIMPKGKEPPYAKWSTPATSHGRHYDPVYEDKTSKEEFLEYVTDRCTSERRYAGCAWGHTEVDMDAKDKVCLHEHMKEKKTAIPKDLPDECKKRNYITMQVQGEGKTCKKTEKGGWSCKRVIQTSTAAVLLNILEPNLELILSKPPLYDAYGFESQNLDGTYYLHDPIHVVHHPVFKWNDDRGGGTINFKVWRHWCPDDGECSESEKRQQIPIANTFDCTLHRCSEIFSIPRHTDTIWSMGNGDGQTAYNATSDVWLGLHDLLYRIEVYNIEYIEERLLNSTNIQTDAKVVVFDPAFHSTTYPVLADDEKYGHENRFALASWYNGSWGGGPNDANMTEPYKYRRARMDTTYGALAGYNPANLTTLSWNLTWSGAPRTPAHVLGYGAPDYPDVSFHSTSSPLRPGLVPLSPDGAAMWPKAGYGRIFFDFPDIAQYGLGEPGTRYANATAYIYTMVHDFASVPYKAMASGVYTYPDTLFHQRIIVRSVDSEGNIKPLDISLVSEPRLDLGAIYLADYIHEKTLHDTEDAGFADLAVHDTYPMELDLHTETGYIDAKVRRTASLFTKFSHAAHQGEEAQNGPGPLSPFTLLLPGANETAVLLGSVISPGLTEPNPTESAIGALFGFLSQATDATRTISGIVVPDGVVPDGVVPDGFRLDGNTTRPDIEALMRFQNVSREFGYGGLAEMAEGTYLAYPDTSRTNFPLSYGLTVPSPLNVTLGTDSYSQNIDHRLGVTEGTLMITINTDKDNVLLAERTGGILSISYDENFGAMLGVIANGSSLARPTGTISGCAWGCNMYAGWGSLDVTAHNKWGGEAQYHAGELKEPPPVTIPGTSYSEWFIVLALVVFGILVQRLIYHRLTSGVWSIRP